MIVRIFITLSLILFSTHALSYSKMFAGTILVNQGNCEILFPKVDVSLSCTAGVSKVYQVAQVKIHLNSLALLQPPTCLASPSMILGHPAVPHTGDFNSKVVEFVFPDLGSSKPYNMSFNFICVI